MSGSVTSEMVQTQSKAVRTQSEPSLKSLTISGSGWTLFEYGVSQVLRLGSNLILTRLLVPEYFGLLVLVNLFIQALDMFSDLGLVQSIIRHERGEDPHFLNTAWTMQVLRGLLLYGGALLITWPATWCYHRPELLYLLPVTAFGTVFAAFNSTNLILLNRRLSLGRLALINLGTQVFTIVCQTAIAWLWPSVWALVAGILIAHFSRLVASHTLCPGPRNRFHWDAHAAHDLFHFGRWIFISTVFGFLGSRGDQLILGYVLASGPLGFYGIATFIAQGVVQALNTLSGRVLFPVFTRIAAEGPEGLRRKTFRIRSALLAMSLPPICFLAVFGPQVAGFLYDARYHDVGWMLQILSVGAVASAIGSGNGSILLAAGDSFRYMLLMVARTAILLLAMGVGGYCYGSTGVIVGVAAHEFLLYPVTVFCIRRYGVWLPWLDLAGTGASAVLIGLGWLLWQ